MNLENIENKVLSILDNSDTVWNAFDDIEDLFAFIKIKDQLELKPIFLDINGKVELVMAYHGSLCHSDTKIKVRKHDTLSSLLKRIS